MFNIRKILFVVWNFQKVLSEKSIRLMALNETFKIQKYTHTHINVCKLCV